VRSLLILWMAARIVPDIFRRMKGRTATLCQLSFCEEPVSATCRITKIQMFPIPHFLQFSFSFFLPLLLVACSYCTRYEFGISKTTTYHNIGIFTPERRGPISNLQFPFQHIKTILLTNRLKGYTGQWPLIYRLF
jgi:hypothetical protein